MECVNVLFIIIKHSRIRAFSLAYVCIFKVARYKYFTKKNEDSKLFLRFSFLTLWKMKRIYARNIKSKDTHTNKLRQIISKANAGSNGSPCPFFKDTKFF